ncbi:MAG: serine/threonine phosphatase [Nostocaceae cyanobacterium]|nr:serine/threonine phosphatase [Nostocaceae cyanobacterium]
MLICPQCQFENPNTNKFCQRCGTSLTQKVCSECGTLVAVNEKLCHNCGAMTGTVWWAIIVTQPIFNQQAVSQVPVEPGEQKLQAVETSPEPIIPSVPSISEKTPELPTLAAAELSQLPEVGAYLDHAQRYQLIEPLTEVPENTPDQEVEGRVLDCQPFQISPLMAMVGNQQQTTEATSGGQTNGNGTMAIGIPQIAQAYVDLHSQCYEAIPKIHDAWQQSGMEVLLLEDRSDWAALVDIWRQDQITSLQILHWFYEMTQLWEALEPWNCRQSLLLLSNLRLDEDQSLALQKLYLEPVNTTASPPAAAAVATSADAALSLKDLGQVWQVLFQQSQRTQFGSLVQLLGELQLGKIQTVAQLRSRLLEIAQELEENLTSPATMSSPEPIFNQQQASSTPTIELEVDISTSSDAPTKVPLDEPEENTSKSDDLPTVVLPMQLVSLEDAGRTDVGRQREHNEDFFGIETKINKLEYANSRTVQARGLYILCDGMGGHAGGEIASNLAVKTLRQYFKSNWVDGQLPTQESIRSAVVIANQAIHDINQQQGNSGLRRMGTTLVMLLIQDNKAAVAHVGDSRLYRLTRRGLEQLTLDHEVAQREILRGVPREIATARPDGQQLTQALGPRDENFIDPDVQFFEVNEDTLFILASDGLTDNDLLEGHWHSHIQPLLSSRANLERGVSDLIDLGNKYNGHDNITAVLVRAKVRPNLDAQR